LAKDKEDEASSNYPVLVSRSSRGGMFDQLLKAEEEVRAIAEILKPSLLYVGSDATEEHFKQKSGNFANIHLATHCIVEENQPMYSRIVFAQDDDPQEDGFLHTYEVFNLKLNADLVTLGACETGLGKLSRGEGLIGLTRAVMYAGAPAVVVSLWSVDESTAELMKLFYLNMKDGMTKVEALRQAKLELIQSNGEFSDGQNFSFAHPFLWAPFIVVGKGK
jgi:CHAT domain-containing protein